ncbi:MAG: hypothetical protein HFACDABA_00089 [Anaerolineales bacterium]|nr:hypothetical protein [Anaerolineales bacterium]
MPQPNPFLPRIAQNLIAIIVLALIIAYTYAYFFGAPYSGFAMHPSTGEVYEIFLEDSSASLQIGDQITNIGGVPWKEHQSDPTDVFFKNIQPAEVIEITLLREGKQLTVPWTFPGFNRQQFQDRFLNIWWLAYIFWAFGSLIQTSIRPADVRWRLLSIASYLTGFWIILGVLSGYQVWGSSLLLHAITWLLLPVYLRLHWVFPKNLKDLPAWVWVTLYLIGFALAIAELTSSIPRSLFAFGFFLTLMGSIVLLVIHTVRQPDQRREVARLGIIIAIAIVPSIFLGVFGVANRIPQVGPLALVTLPVIPGAYFYTVYRQQLGGLETRSNRAVSTYIFMTLLGTILLTLIFPAALSLIEQPGALIIASVSAILFMAYIAIAFFPTFQSFVDRRLLGINLPYQHLTETYSSQIAASVSVENLLRLLEEDVFPSLLVRQFAFLEFSNDACRLILRKEVAAEQIPDPQEIPALINQSGRLRPPAEGSPHPWIRLTLSLKVGEEILGLWLFGRRDPDDHYPVADLTVFQSLADQTAIAISNLQQTERLRSLSQLNIERREQDRMNLALELHDSVLNQLAVLRTNVDETNLSPRFHDAYEEVVQRLREIASALRPPMLNYGLKLALEELTQDLMERSDNHTRVTFAVWGEEERYPPNIELHLFRIVQEACENALRHAQANTIIVSAQLDSRTITLAIEDNGQGFEMGEPLQLDDLLIHKHFGLAGIMERANLIGASAQIRSNLNTGTRIEIAWNAPEGD